jgi:hypothetical protein
LKSVLFINFFGSRLSFGVWKKDANKNLFV